jgi:hypothetical protein
MKVTHRMLKNHKAEDPTVQIKGSILVYLKVYVEKPISVLYPLVELALISAHYQLNPLLIGCGKATAWGEIARSTNPRFRKRKFVA